MLWRFLTKQRPSASKASSTQRSSFSLQVFLWTIWTLVVVGVGFFSWHADMIAHRPVNTLGFVIHCVLAGMVGLVVLTLVEMHVEPWRFMGDDERDT